MLFKSVLVLCTLSVFFICYALSSDHIYGNPRHWNREIYFDDVAVPPRYSQDHSSETTTEKQVKEYGIDSKHYDQSKKKYFISTEAVPWFDARDACQAKGMVLACPATHSENRELFNHLRDHNIEPGTRNSGYWLGSYISSEFSPWLWECNGQEVPDFGWYPGEPNLPEEEHCMELRKMLFFAWKNIPCALPRGYICESLSQNPTQESDKNNIQDKKGTLHEELRKNSVNEGNGINFDKDIPRLVLPSYQFEKDLGRIRRIPRFTSTSRQVSNWEISGEPPSQKTSLTLAQSTRENLNRLIRQRQMQLRQKMKQYKNYFDYSNESNDEGSGSV